MSKKFASLVVSLSLLVAASFAQVTGRLSGTVLDSSGASIAGAKVELMVPGSTSAVLSTRTNAAGLFSFAGVRPAAYDMLVSSAGFVSTAMRGVKVDPARETALPPFKLDVAAVAQTIDVTANTQSVQTANAEISSTVTAEQVARLPMLDRNVLALINTQAGVGYSGRGATVINGMHASFANVTLDGINVQDNYIRGNALDLNPNRLELDQVAEFTVSTSNASAAVGGGAAQVSFVTPSGTNTLHGSAYWSNRNNALAANDWFNNSDGIANDFLNQNQFGASAGGRIIRDKLFFYTNYEGMRRVQSYALNRTILTDSARQGLFTYKDQGGNVQQVNVLTLTGVPADPYMQKLISEVPTGAKINNFRAGDSREGFLRNTGGYAFNASYNRVRDNVTGKLDYNLSTKHVFAGTYAWNKEVLDRPTYGTDYATKPKVTNDNPINLLSLAWRWNPGPTLTNELRGGFNLAPARFDTSQEFPDFLLGTLLFGYPINNFRAQGRYTNTYNLQDNASHMRGRHNIQFGFQMQAIRVESYNDAGITPTYNIGISSANTYGLKAQQFPGGIGASDVSAANALLANLAGFITSDTQTFNVKDRTSGFVNNYNSLRHFTYDNYAGYVQDTWKVSPHLTATLGLRYEYFTRLDERDALSLLPVIQNGNYINTLMSNATMDFAGGAVGRPWYNADRNNFAPNVGLAWDPFGGGKTTFRAGYSVAYVNDEAITAIYNNVNTNGGLQSVSTVSGMTARVSVDRPGVPVPVYKIPRTQADNYATNTQAAMGMPDPNLRTPYVQQWSFGVQHDLKGTILEARYVGNKMTKGLRAFDYNQVSIRDNGFLADFQRAQSNGTLARAATGAYNPNYNAAIPGSQPLQVFPLLPNGGNLTGSANINYLQQGLAGEMANNYQITRANGPVNFYRNPLALGLNTITNYSNSSYNALQVEARRTTRRGLTLQANYTFSKVLSDVMAEGNNGQARFEPFLDMANPKIERARAGFDLTHAFKVNYVYDLPLGKGHAVDLRPLRALLGGWSTGGSFNLQSGTPFSILSQRGTLNRTARSTWNTATSLLTAEQLKDVVGFWMTGNGPVFINPANTNPQDGRGVAPDGQPAFAGQAFYNPGAGSVGALQRRMFTGPSVWTFDFSLHKKFTITERQSMEFRMDSTNLFNHATFWVGDEYNYSAAPFNINDSTFGTVQGTFYDRRLIQFSLRYKF